MVEPPSRLPWVLFIVLVLVAAGGLAALVYVKSRITPPSPGPTVAIGDNVTVNYIGYFGSGPQAGKVFDTSLYSVATNNATYPKSLEFSFRGNASAYTPLAVHVGTTPPSGYTIGNLTYVGVVPGFWQGLVGLSGNVSHSASVPPSLGYGSPNRACFRTLPLRYDVPVVETFSSGQFSALYPGVTTQVGTVFSDPHYGWNVTIFSVNSSFVTILNQPYVGEVTHPTGGWPVTVVQYLTAANGSALIVLQNGLSASSAYTVAGTDFNGTGPCSSQNHGRFLVSAIDPAAGTYTEDFNPEVQGETLVFVVTVVDIHS
jgi:FKBP-type peptidyl-prolyl cis-trans isomerase 2